MEIYRQFQIEAAHRLPNVPADHKCARLHGHSFRIAVHVTGDVDPDAGWVQDFADIRAAFEQMGGFPDLPLMEDVAFSRALKRLGTPAAIRDRVSTSARRWEEHGVARTIALMWALRLGYAMGVDPAQLAKAYRPEQK